MTNLQTTRSMLFNEEKLPMARLPHPSNLELQALSVLWNEGPSTVATLLEMLPDKKERAYTTVLSVMQSLERKRLVTHTIAGKAYVYAATHAQEVIVKHLAYDFIIHTFGGRLGEALLAILSAGRLTPEEKTNIERELQRHNTMAAKKPASNAAAKPAKKPVTQVASKTPAKKVSPQAVSKVPATKTPAKKAVSKVVKKIAKSAKKIVVQAVAPKVVKKAAPVKTAAPAAPAKKVAKPTPVKKVAATKKPIVVKKIAKKVTKK